MINILFLIYDISCFNDGRLAFLTKKHSLNTTISRENKAREKKNCTHQTSMQYRR
jgi:hypothetical protein